MAESIPHTSRLELGGIGPVTWTAHGGTTERRILIEVRGLLALPLDEANRFIGEVRSAVRQAESASHRP